MPAYSPERRTAVVLSGPGVHGAYHAGVLRALQESGVKSICWPDMAPARPTPRWRRSTGRPGCGKPDGLWLGPQARLFYSWTMPVRALVWLLVALASLFWPLSRLVVASGLIVYPLGFLSRHVRRDPPGPPWSPRTKGWLQSAFSADVLTHDRSAARHRAGRGCGTSLGGVDGRAAGRAADAVPSARTWWRVVGAPMDAEVARQAMTATVGQVAARYGCGAAASARSGGATRKSCPRDSGSPASASSSSPRPISTGSATWSGRCCESRTRGVHGRPSRARTARRRARLQRERPRPVDRSGGRGADACRGGRAARRAVRRGRALARRDAPVV
jgi:hypothetical protein